MLLYHISTFRRLVFIYMFLLKHSILFGIIKTDLMCICNFRRAFENIFNLLDKEGECFIILVAYNPVFEVYRTLTKDEKWNTWVHDVEKYISPYHDSEV